MKKSHISVTSYYLYLSCTGNVQVYKLNIEPTTGNICSKEEMYISSKGWPGSFGKSYPDDNKTNLVVAFLTNDMCWLEWTNKRGYVSWWGTNLCLTPVHDFLLYCIQEWTRKLDSALMKIKVWPNSCQGIIDILSGGMLGQFWETIRGKNEKVSKPSLVPQDAGLRFSTFLLFGGR